MKRFFIALFFIYTSLLSQEMDQKIGLKELTVVIEELIKRQNENNQKLEAIKKELAQNTKKLETLSQLSEENAQEIRYISNAIKEIAQKLETSKDASLPKISNIIHQINSPTEEPKKGIINSNNANIRKSMDTKKSSVLFKLDKNAEISIIKQKNKDWYQIIDKLYIHKSGLKPIKEQSEPTLDKKIVYLEVDSNLAQLKKEPSLNNESNFATIKKGTVFAAKEVDNEWFEIAEKLYVHESNVNITN